MFEGDRVGGVAYLSYSFGYVVFWWVNDVYRGGGWTIITSLCSGGSEIKLPPFKGAIILCRDATSYILLSLLIRQRR